MSSTLRTLGVALRAVLLATLVLGLGYPAVILGVGQLALPAQAQGSLLTDPGTGAALGSRLLGQDFADAAGAPLPGWFQGRPSAAGDGYDGRASSGSNLGPEHPELIAQVTERRALLARANGVAPAEIPADAL
ncbi:potassium-transporting ATPase subunit C, partial [Leucobacter sp. M11]|uniref:potassium-transporting ATPase subunit C n=1 Tax=Leucobacter sp. M11 TaxID=2993565 RepID=UPI002D7E9CBA